MKVIILAGGSGTRLWPISTEKKPKQFCSFFGGKTLLEQAIQRAEKIVPAKDIIIVASKAHRALVEESIHDEHVVLYEKYKRNTLGAICLALQKIADDQTVYVFSSDHFIDGMGFEKVCAEAQKAADKGYLCVFGAKPNRPHTGYGYIAVEERKTEGGYCVRSFVEKPDAKRAAQYIEKGYFWNCGIFAFSKEVFMKHLKKHQLAWYNFVEKKASLPKQGISIDYGVLEKAHPIFMVPMEKVTWSDVGSFDALWELHKVGKQGNVEKGSIRLASSLGNYIDVQDVQVVGIDVHDLCVVQRGSQLLICPKSSSQKVGKMIQAKEMKKKRSVMRKALFPLAYAVTLALKVRHRLYDAHWFSVEKPDLCVISVGNIQMGGSGKTPFTLYLAKKLEKWGVSFGFVSRGYKSQAEKKPRSELLYKADPALFGDEPCLLHKHFPKVPCAVGKNKVHGAELIAKQGKKVALLDDGMQHRALGKDLNLVLVNGKDPLAGGVFPMGLLREDPTQLKQADMVVVVGGDLIHVEKQLRSYTQAPLIHAEKKVVGVFDAKDQPLDLKGKKIAAYCGIAHPDGFFEMLEKKGAILIDKIALSDHGILDDQKRKTLEKKLKEKLIDYVVCTEKDLIKIKKPHVGWAFLKIEMEVTQGEERLDALLQERLKLEKKSKRLQDKKPYVTV